MAVVAEIIMARSGLAIKLATTMVQAAVWVEVSLIVLAIIRVLVAMGALDGVNMDPPARRGLVMVLIIQPNLLEIKIIILPQNLGGKAVTKHVNNYGCLLIQFKGEMEGEKK